MMKHQVETFHLVSSLPSAGDLNKAVLLLSLKQRTHVRVDNLAHPWSAGWEARYFKMIFCAGVVLGETCQEKLDTDGCIEWAEPLKISMRGGTERLVAIVVSRRFSDGGLWSLVPGCRFEGFSVNVGHFVWRHASAHPGAGPNAQAELETVAVEDDSIGERFETFLDSAEHSFLGLDQNRPASAFPSVFPGIEMNVPPARGQDGDGQALQEPGAPTKQPRSFKQSTWDTHRSPLHRAASPSASYPTGPRSLTSLSSRKSSQAKPPSRIEYGRRLDRGISSGWYELAGDSVMQERALDDVSEKGWQAVHTRPVVRPTQPLRKSAKSDRGSERYVVPRSQRSMHPFISGTSIGRKSRVVSPLQTGPRRTTPTTFVASTSSKRVFVLDSASSTHSDVPPPPSIRRIFQSPVQSSLLALPEVEVEPSIISTPRSFAALSTRRSSAAAFSPRLPLAAGSDSPSSSYNAIVVRAPSGSCEFAADSARFRAQSKGLFLAMADQFFSYDYYDGVQPRSADYPMELVSVETSTVLENDTCSVSAQELNTSNVPFNTERMMPRGEASSVGTRGAHASASHTTGVARIPSPGAVEVAFRPDKRPLLAENQCVLSYGCRADRQLSSEDYATELVSAEASTMLGNDTASTSAYALDTSDVPFNTERLMPRGEVLSAMTQRSKDAASHIAAIARNPSPEDQHVPLYDYRDDRHLSSEDYATELVLAKTSTKLWNDTTPSSAHARNTSKGQFNTERLMPRGGVSSLLTRRAHGSASRIAAFARNPGRETVEFTCCPVTRPPLAGAVKAAPSRPHASTAEPFEALATVEGAGLVEFTCFPPQFVCGGREFQLRVSACSGRVEDYPSRATSREGAIEVGVPGAMRIARGKRVAMNLGLPKSVFKVLDGNSVRSNALAAHRPPSMRDFVWNGVEHEETFRVTCLPGVAPGAVDCRMCLVEGNSATRLSFSIEVMEDGHTWATGDTSAMEELGATLDGVEVTIGEDDPRESTISDTERVSGIQQNRPATEEETADQRVPTRASKVCPPPPFILANRVDPGPSVHESKEHGFRLTVQDSSLISPIGPVTVQEFTQVVKCEDDGQEYLVKTVVDCRPSGSMFPDKPLLMDFRIEDTSSTNIPETCQVLVRKGGAEGWTTIKSEVRVDQWGTYLRAAVSHFCLFTWGIKVNPSDPARLESCDKKDMIEVQNATEEEIYFVLVPVSFDSDKMSRVTYTGHIGFGVAGIPIEARGGSGYESAVKCHMLPAGFTPDDISVGAGGKFQFSPPPGASQGKLLVATITENSQCGLSVKVVVLHGKFNTPKGKRRVILPICLRSKSRIGARLGPNDIPVDMVMIMAGMGSKTTSMTEALSPRSSTRSGAPFSRDVSLSLPPRSAQRRGGTMRSCPTM